MTRILVIEPDKEFLEEIEKHINNLGYSAITTTNGASGVQKALQYKPDLILSDTEPEGLAGQEVFNMIKQVNTTSLIPFVFLTTKKSYQELRAVMNLGVDDFMVKPFEFSELKQLIEIRLEKQKRIIEKTSEKFNKLIDYANTPLCIYKEDKFDYVNIKCCEIFGYSKGELIGMNLVNLIYKDDIQGVIDKINRCFRNLMEEIEVEFRAIRRNREVVPLTFDAKLVDVEGTKYLVGSIEKDEQPGFDALQINGFEDLTLTPREKDILHCICQGHSNQDIAEKLNISVRTVEGHRNRLLKKTGCNNSVCLAVYAIKHNLYKV
jgi:PAS domain S-box-containing protein